MGVTRNHLISIDELSDKDLRYIVRRGTGYARQKVPVHRTLEGLVIGIYFSQTSTRTRTAFSSGALRLGGQIITYGPHDLQTNTGESVADTGRVLASMLDLLVIRTAGDQDEMRQLAGPSGMSVVNAMSASEHPTQALADLTTLTEAFGQVDGLRVLYLGEGNNTCTALALALSRFAGTHFEARTPPGYGMPPELLDRARRRAERSGSTVLERHDLTDLPPEMDVIYTTRWQTTGTTKSDPNWREMFAPFQVHQGLWQASPDALFLHDLPANRGEEVTAEVLDGPRSIAFRQAENKLHSAMAVLNWCVHGRLEG